MIIEHVFIRRLFFIRVFSEKSARGCQRRPFESSKNFDETQFLQTSVYPNARVPHEIQPGNGCELLRNPIYQGAINGANHRCLEFRNRARIQYRKRMNYSLHPLTGPLLLDRLQLMEGIDFG